MKGKSFMVFPQDVLAVEWWAKEYDTTSSDDICGRVTGSQITTPIRRVFTEPWKSQILDWDDMSDPDDYNDFVCVNDGFTNPVRVALTLGLHYEISVSSATN